MNDRRNPYFILGVDYGVDLKQARAAFAKVTRRLRREPDAMYSLEDATWALHEIEHVLDDPEAALGIYRVPGYDRCYDYVFDDGTVPEAVPGISYLGRRSGSSDDDVIRLKAEVLDTRLNDEFSAFEQRLQEF